MPGPLLVQPRLDAKPWGARRLTEYGITLPADARIGEALLTAPESVVASGPMAGATLGELAAAAPACWVGERGLAVTGGRAIFPLLIKLIDANADLSIQVHPDDCAAGAAGLGTGKTEAWHILDATPDSRLYLGLRPEADASAFQRACEEGSGAAAAHMRQIPARPGMTVIVPAGTPHAIGRGVLLYEIQQPSNVTFRLDDWGRCDEAGHPRALHHREGFAVLDATARPASIEPMVLAARGPRRELLAATRYFALERIAGEPGDVAHLSATASPRVVTCLHGRAVLHAAGVATPLGPGVAIVLPAGASAELRAETPAVVLRGWVPDLQREVIAPARAAGATEAAIEQLGIALGQ